MKTAPTKRRVAVIFGGSSVEHEVSINSARTIVAAIDTQKFDIDLIGINKAGEWRRCRTEALLAGDKNLLAGPAEKRDIIPYANSRQQKNYDVVFPVLHGTGGEDGTLQGLLTLANIPFVGPGVLGSAIAMDKEVSKRLWRDAGLSIADFVSCKAHQRKALDFSAVSTKLGLPLFVKPASLGSSVGVSKVRTEEEFVRALDTVFTYDTKVLIEQYIEGQEVECAVLGNEYPKVSEPGSIVPTAEFYSYDAKYTNKNGATLTIPAQISPTATAKIKQMAITAFTTVECEGMARIDFFVTKDEQIFLNEINTIPGFTPISMYPKLWEHSGLSRTELITTLLDLAIARFDAQQRLTRSIS